MKRTATQREGLDQAGDKAGGVPRGPVRFLVIGYGNTLRGDDGVGPLAAEQVQQWKLPHVTAISCHQLTPELADTARHATSVIFVDALAPNPEPRALRFEQLHELAPPSYNPHQVSCPCSLLALTRDLYQATPEGWVVGIPGETFEHGADLSPRAALHLKDALKRIRALVDGRPP